MADTYTCKPPAMALMRLNVIRLNAMARIPTKPKATAPMLASQLDHLVSHQLSVCTGSVRPPASAVAISPDIILPSLDLAASVSEQVLIMDVKSFYLVDLGR